ncbi:uncharacterized protein LOC136078265 [Hydra vulgaris]|uniref:Uncharacterized protein LOC136078265 n=1 Tax=Hydra vulgaris TaxID=6087 RepID=A0ABM4BL11_HYDVU
MEDEGEWKPINNPIGKYNLVKLPRFAMELVRNECSSNIGAALANALLYDIKYLLKNDVNIKDILIDKCKLDRAKSKVKIVSEDVDSEQKKQLICLGVDSKLNQITKTSKVINSPQVEVIKKCIKPEHHLIFTYEDGESSGNYLTHRMIPVTGATGLVFATEMFSVLQEHNSLESIQAVLLDNTATNTGPISGLVVKLEKFLKRKLHLIGCALHQYELPLRALIVKLDGDTTGPRSFSGLLGKRCAENIKDRNQVLFECIENPIVDKYIPEEILIDLSCDQRLLFEYCK